MPFTVITLKKVPPSLKGDLTKWMQEIAVGVYVGNFNTRVREQLWKRVCENVGEGEATMSYACRNEIGYQFETFNSMRVSVDYEGIPMVFIPHEPSDSQHSPTLRSGFSNAAKYHKARQFSKSKHIFKGNYAVIDIETNGLNAQMHSIIELGAVKVEQGELQTFNRLIRTNDVLSKEIVNLTGITQELLENEGVFLKEALSDFLKFVGDIPLVGYNIEFDINFINHALSKTGLAPLRQMRWDLIKYVKQEHLFLSDYKLQTVLEVYGIDKLVPHRATEDSRLIYDLSLKVNKFQQAFQKKC